MPVQLQDDMIGAHGINPAGPGCPIDPGDPDGFGAVFRIEQSIPDGAPSSQRDGSRLLFGLEDLGQLVPETTRDCNQVGVSQGVHDALLCGIM